MTVAYSHETGETSTIKERAIQKLKKNPLLKPKELCKLLDLPYKHYGSYISNIRSDWRLSLKVKHGSKVEPSYHKAQGWVYVDRVGLKVEDAVRVGWLQSRMKNHALIWKDRKIGRMVWFPSTGRVNLYIKPPALKGRVFQLFCNGFSMTGLVESMTVLSRLLESIRLKSAHAVFETSHRLPYMVIDLFKLSSGIVIRSGDKSHPNAIEVEFCYPDWAEENERLLQALWKSLKPDRDQPSQPKRLNSYVA